MKVGAMYRINYIFLTKLVMSNKLDRCRDNQHGVDLNQALDIANITTT